MKIISAAILIMTTSCASVWPKQCDISWRGKTTCKCEKSVVHVKKSSVDISCNGSALPIEISGTTSVNKGE